MSFLDLNDDVRSILSKHFLNDNATTGLASNKTFMTKPDDYLPKKLFGEVTEMDMSIFEFKKNSIKKNQKIDDEIEFFKENCNKIYTVNISFFLLLIQEKKKISMSHGKH
jgi:hypothetical protein